jgi:hypothetical protein
MNAMSTNSLGLSSDPTTEVRAALADYLLVLRYRLGSDADGWYLGGGQEKAVDFLVSLESKEDTKDIVLELRKAFDIPLASYIRRSTGPSAFHERDVSFDLEQYIADIGPQGDEEDESDAKSTTRRFTSRKRREPKPHLTYRASVASIATTATTKSSGSSHQVGDFAIMEATRVPLSIKEVAYRFPDDSALPKTPRMSPSKESGARLGIIPRFSKSMTNLVEAPTRLRRVTQRLTATPLLPAFQESPQASPSTTPVVTTQFPATVTTQFPTMTPPLSPAITDSSTALGGGTPSPPGSVRKITLPLPVEEFYPTVSPERRRSREHLRSRRQQFRQHVIVDGEHHSPDRKPGLLVQDTDDFEKEGTLLSSLLPLLSASTIATEAHVEERFTFVFDREVQRALARGELFGPDGRARVIWMLEQVANEVCNWNRTFS